MRTQRASVTAATILLVAAVTAVSAAWAIASPSEPQLGTGTETLDDASQDREVRPSPGVRQGDRARERGDGASVAVRSADLETTAGQAIPRRLTIPSLGVDSPVVPTGVTRAGNAQIPADGDVIGWYEYGSAPGDDRGNTILIGHRDTQAEGPGALFDLDLLTEGASISVAAGRSTVDYRVVAVRSVEKSGLPASLFRRTGPPRLVVITCGGAFIPEAGGYQENLYAVAVPRKG
jgi:LPXTG-site transpeptidase (sortase) family protein